MNDTQSNTPGKQLRRKQTGNTCEHGTASYAVVHVHHIYGVTYVQHRGVTCHNSYWIEKPKQ